MTNKVEIIEVGPRDGYQSVKEYIPIENKLEIIDKLVASGVKCIEHTSFVSPKAVPQLRDAVDVTKYCIEKYPDVEFFALVPNLYGAKMAVSSGLKKITNVISLSKSHNKANINRSHEESIDELKKIIDEFEDLEVCVDVATAFGCPFEGIFKTEQLIEFLDRLYSVGVRNFNLCDTVGVANPKQVREVVTTVLDKFKDCVFEIHIHDTRNMGIVNTLVAIESGIKRVQTTLGGLGGCPFAPGASGNTSTEDLVYMLNQMGYNTGIDFNNMLEVAKYQKKIINGQYSGHHININKSICI